MNELKVFVNDQLGEIRVIIRDGEPWFVLADICKLLDIENTTDVAGRLNQDYVSQIEVIENSGFGARRMKINIINELNLYKCIMRSYKPEAEKFQDWVCGEVLPQIRKTGMYNFFSKDHQKRSMEKLQALLPELEREDQVNYIKANTVVNKAVSNFYGFAKMIKKNNMSEEMLDLRAKVLEDYVKLFEVIQDNHQIKEIIYTKYSNKLIESSGEE